VVEIAGIGDFIRARQSCVERVAIACGQGRPRSRQVPPECSPDLKRRRRILRQRAQESESCRRVVFDPDVQHPPVKTPGIGYLLARYTSQDLLRKGVVPYQLATSAASNTASA